MGVADLLERLDRMSPQRRADFAQVLTERGSFFGVYPLSPAQRRMWFVDQLYPDSAVHNVPYAFLLRGELDLAALRTSFDELVRRHEALRMTVFAVHGTPWQAVNEPRDGVLLVEDALDVADVWEAAKTYAAEEAGRPFALAHEPPLRARLVRFAGNQALLMVTAHHVVADGGWSMRVLFAELMRWYEALAETGLPPEAADPPAFAELVRAQEEHAARRASGSSAYWREQLAGAPTVLDLPVDRQRQAVAMMRGDVAETCWPGPLAGAVVAFARQHRVTPFAVLFAGFALLLHRYSGSDDVLVGTAVSNRDGVRGVDAIGLFINTVVLRSKAPRGSTFRSLVSATMNTITGAQRHQEFPFESVVELLKPERDTSHHPVIQVLCGLQNTHADGFRLGAVSAEVVPVHTAAAKADLGLTYALDDDAVRCWLEFDSDLFTPGTAQRLLGHLGQLLSAALAEPDQDVELLPMLPEAEREQLVHEWGRGEREALRAKLPYELFEEQADRTPDARAVSCRDTVLTYRELDEAANGLARVLRAAGVGPDERVGIHLPRGVEMAVGVLGVWKAGGAYVPVDAEQPPARCAEIFADAGISVAVTTKALLDRLPAGVTAVDVEAGTSADRLPLLASADDLAYVIYTSGSTGRPKGVAVPHVSAANTVHGLTRVTGVQATDRVLQFASNGFDASVAEFLIALTNGAELVFAPKEDLQPGPELEETVRAAGVTTAFLSPTVLAVLRRDQVPDLRILVVGSEMVPPALAFEWSQGRHLLFAYGPTETTVISTVEPCTRLETIAPIGRPLSNEDVYVLDGAMRPVPRGVRGELYLGGAALARCYLGQPALTAQRFVPDPFSGRPGARLYRTGDVVRFREDGVLECFGRADDQVKIRGIRIELGEIGHRLGLQPDVAACAVAAVEFGAGDRRLVAYVVPAAGARVDDRRLRGGLREVLPEYMVPSRFVEVREIPQNASGKTDYRALRDLAASVVTAVRPVASDLGEAGRVVARTWCEVLQVAEVGADDNFFDLGGNSLLISRVAALLRERLDQPVTALTLLRHPTVRSLAEHLGGVTREVPSGSRPAAREQRRQTAALRARRRGGRPEGSAE